MKVETKEIELLQKETESELSEVKVMEITNAEQMKSATDVLGKIKSYAKKVKEKKETITKPMNDALKEVRNLFRPIELFLDETEISIKNKMLTFQRVEAERIRQEEAKIMARIEKGTMKTETAMNKLENVGEVQKSVKSDFGSVSTRKIKKWRITNSSIIPREYLTIDTVKVSDCMRAGIAIQGIEYYEEETISARGL